MIPPVQALILHRFCELSHRYQETLQVKSIFYSLCTDHSLKLHQHGVLNRRICRAKIIYINKALTHAVLNDHLALAILLTTIELLGSCRVFFSRKLLHQIKDISSNPTARLGFVSCKFIPII